MPSTRSRKAISGHAARGNLPRASFVLKVSGMPPGRSELSPDLQALLADAVDSFEKLELVLYLNHVDAVPMPARDLAAEVGVREDLVLEALGGLVRDGVLNKHESGWSLHRQGRWSAQLVDLARVAESDRTVLLKFLTARAVNRVRIEAARVFADAFILNPKKKGGSDA